MWSEHNVVVGQLAPATHSTGATDTTVIDGGKLSALSFIILTGNLSGGGVVDFKLQSAVTSGGSYADMAGYAIAPINHAGGGSSKLAIIDVDPAALGDGKRYVRGRLTISTASAQVAVMAIGRLREGEPSRVGFFNLVQLLKDV